MAALAIILAAGPQVGRAETLDAAVMRGLARHPDVRLAEVEVRQAALQVTMSRNAYLPTFSASSGPAAAGLGYDVSVSQPLFDWGMTAGFVDQKRVELAQQEAALAVARDDIALQIAEAYLDVVSRRTQLSFLQDYLGRLQKVADMAGARVESRYADLSESGRVALALATAEGTRARLDGELAEAIARYELLVEAPAEGLRLPDEPPSYLQSVAEEGAMDEAIAASPLYRKAALEVAAADAGLREARAARLPRFYLEGGVQRREIGGRLVDDSSISLRMRVSSQQGLEALQRPELERQRREAAQWAAEAQARNLKRTVGALVRADAALQARIDALSDQAAQAEAVRGVYGEQFLVGRRDIQDLVVMETEAFESQRQRVDLIIERLRLQYRAAAQLGRLTPMMAGDEMQAVAVHP